MHVRREGELFVPEHNNPIHLKNDNRQKTNFKASKMVTVTKGLTISKSDRMKATLDLTSGARFYRCALQVNPFAYLQRHGKQTDYGTEEDYNKAIVETCLEIGIEVIAVTDHHRVHQSESLVSTARKSGIFVFYGFEAVTKDGVHFLCLFDSDIHDVGRILGECGIHNTDQPPPTGKYYALELLENSRTWGAVCIAAHVASEGGLLKKLSGQSRISVWQSPYLLACALPGPLGDAPEGIIPILKNKNPDYKRDRLPAIVNASDVNGPEDLRKHSASCFIKMSAISIEGFRQAFLDPESRIRLHSDPNPEPHAEFLGLTFEGGFLRDTSVHFNENLNVLVGGRGTGKSTMLESIRYALDLEPLVDDARKAHEGVIRYVLQPGTKVSLLVRSHKPSPRCYTIERSVPNPPVVKDENGEVLTLLPSDVMPGVEVFGQHEISELTKNPEKLTKLLDRFVDRDPSLSERKSQVRLELERSRNRISDVRREIKILEDRLAALPGLEEKQERYKQVGLEDRLNEKSMLIREERLFAALEEKLESYRMIRNELVGNLPIDTTFVSCNVLEELPNADILAEIEILLNSLSDRLKEVDAQFESALNKAEIAAAKTKASWDERRIVAEETYEKLLRELQESNVDGEGFIQLRRRIEELRPLRDRAKNLMQDHKVHLAERRNLLAEWEDIKATEFRQVETAAKRVSRKLRNRVEVKVMMAGNRDPLEQLLREVGGNLSAAISRLRSREHLSLPDLANRCSEGKESLIEHYGLPAGAAERIAQVDISFLMRIQELELPATTEIKLNTAPENQPAKWQTLNSLSTGQKATAVLLLLLLESETPLVVDQPEDDLDNRFITEIVIPIIRKAKRRRQFVFSTHNANIPVLGDAELILGLAASGEANEGKARIASEHMGSIDAKFVRELVEEILEGGKAAFEMRRSKYGY